MRNKLSLVIFTFAFFSLSPIVLGQEGITSIDFHYSGPNHLKNPKIRELLIRINKINDDVLMHIYIDKTKWEDYLKRIASDLASKNKVMEGDSLIITKRNPYEKDSHDTYKLNAQEFESIISSIKLIKSTDISNEFSKNGIHGYSCSIEFGGYSTSIKYQVWSPGQNPNERGIQNFYESCKLILSIAGINPRKVLK